MDLKDKAIKFKGSDYVLVKDRVLFFNENYPNGSIETELISDYVSDLIVIKATIRPDVATERKFTGYSQAKVGDGYINKTSALENAETSAVGRALAMMGIGVIDSIASMDELHKANTYPTSQELNKSKLELVDKFKEQGIVDEAEILKFIKDTIGKPNISSTKEVEKVLTALKEGK